MGGLGVCGVGLLLHILLTHPLPVGGLGGARGVAGVSGGAIGGV